MVAKMPASFGWTDESIKGSALSNLLGDIVNMQTIEALQTRDNGATFMAHHSVVQDLLRASGQHGVFLKTHKAHDHQFQYELLRLPEEITHADALSLVKAEKALGLVAKNAKIRPRFALRFNTSEELGKAAKSLNLPDQPKPDDIVWRA